MMPLITHWHGHCLVPQKGRGWLIKYWLKRDDLFKAFCKDILQNMDGLEWQGHLYLTVSISAFLVFFHAFSYTGVYFLYNIQHFYPLKWNSLKISNIKASRKESFWYCTVRKRKEGSLTK